MKASEQFQDVANRVAKDLPEGYEIIIRIEQGSGVVILEDPFGDELDFASNHECLHSEVVGALEYAIEHDKEHHDEYFDKEAT